MNMMFKIKNNPPRGRGGVFFFLLFLFGHVDTITYLCNKKKDKQGMS